MPTPAVALAAAALLLAGNACAGERPVPPPRTEVIAAGLEVPWALAFAPDGRLFFTEEIAGRLRVLHPQGGGYRLQPEPVLTFPPPRDVPSTLRGLALDPEFAANGAIYLVYTYAGPDGTLLNRLSRFDRNGERALAERLPMAVTNFGGRLKFGPDGKLYLTTGYVNDFSQPQDLAARGGKLLRLNPDGSVPDDNPFPGSPVFSYGHRNPQGLAWHPRTGRLFTTEHGPTGEGGRCCNDEVNLIAPGGNYGWPEVVGTSGGARYALPVLTSGDETWAPAGADFYRGPAPQWQDSLFFTALRGQALHQVTFPPPGYDRPVRHSRLLDGTHGRLRDVVSGPDGCLYVATSNRDARTNAQPVEGDDRILRVCPGRFGGGADPSARGITVPAVCTNSMALA